MSNNSTHIGKEKKFLVVWGDPFSSPLEYIKSIVNESDADGISQQVNDKDRSIKVETKEETYYLPYIWYQTMYQLLDVKKTDD